MSARQSPYACSGPHSSQRITGISLQTDWQIDNGNFHSQATLDAYSNPGTQVGTQNKDLGAVFQMDLARSRRTLPRTEKLAILSLSGRLVCVVSCCIMGWIVLWTGGLAARSGTEFNERFFYWLQRGRKGNWANFVPRNSPTVQFDTKSTQSHEKAPNDQNVRTLVNNIFTIN